MHRFILALLPLLLVPNLAYAQAKPKRLSSVDLKQRIIWGSELIVHDDLGLAFGGQDQVAGGAPPTRVRVKAEWQPLAEEQDEPTRILDSNAQALAARLAELRRCFLAELPIVEVGKDHIVTLTPTIDTLHELSETSVPAMRLRYAAAEKLVRQAQGAFEQVLSPGLSLVTPELLARVNAARVSLEQAAALTTPTPRGRALSPITYDKATNRFVLIGGDHLDYLTNDTWLFDPEQKTWELQLPPTAPPPRANHQLTAAGDGKIVLSGGYTYTSNTDYTGGQYIDLVDGPWTYDIAKNEWSGGSGVTPQSRTYRTGKFLPEYFLAGAKPDRQAQAKVLEALPSNQWVSLKPPHLPEMNRDWGTAVLDSDRDLILRWSGGHSAHCGTDVLHYHIATNRWELPYAVEFPLGQTYSNTEYPEGTNFNGRPWVTGHTYQNYGYDPLLKEMLFTGRENGCFLYDVARADWQGQIAKPKGMSYNSCFYTLTVTPTPRGLVCWTNEGRIFQFDGKEQWSEHKLSGEKMPGSVVDNSTIVYDAKRNRLLAVLKEYGDNRKFSGDLYAIDCATWQVAKLEPAERTAATEIPYLCQLRYDAAHDLLLVGGTLPPDESGQRRTPAYDCAGNRWISLKITGDDPSPKGRNVSLGMMYDASRKLFLAVDTKSNVFALRLEINSADVQEMK